MTTTLRRITTEYIEIEDRLRISGEIADAEAVVIWLTQRLLLRLLPLLLQWLDQQTQHTVNNANTPPPVSVSAQVANRSRPTRTPTAGASKRKQRHLAGSLGGYCSVSTGGGTYVQERR